MAKRRRVLGNTTTPAHLLANDVDIDGGAITRTSKVRVMCSYNLDSLESEKGVNVAKGSIFANEMAFSTAVRIDRLSKRSAFRLENHVAIGGERFSSG